MGYVTIFSDGGCKSKCVDPIKYAKITYDPLIHGNNDGTFGILANAIW